MSVAENHEKIIRIATSKIPVAEDSVLFNHFLQRRKLAETLKNTRLTEEESKHLISSLDYIESDIKKYLFL